MDRRPLDPAGQREDIRQVLCRYARGMDRPDWDLVKECFHDGALDEHGVYVGTIDDFIKFAIDRHRRVYLSMHFLGNMTIKVNGLKAAAETYCHALQWYAADSADHLLELFGPGATVPAGDAPLRLSMWVRYLDAFEYRDGTGWRIAHRKLVYESLWWEQLTAGDPRSTRFSFGRTSDDPSFALFASLGDEAGSSDLDAK